ncbi:MAG: leucine-rich repeat domain-containing protein [Chlamydiae bacterium]|nr:leucine-rich repeat domain-containing protein [Chlamydiota bacterium]
MCKFFLRITLRPTQEAAKRILCPIKNQKGIHITIQKFISDHKKIISNYPTEKIPKNIAEFNKQSNMLSEKQILCLQKFNLTNFINNFKKNTNIPKDVTKIIDESTMPTSEQIYQLQTYCKARDTITVWKVLADAINSTHSDLDSFTTSEEVIQKATNFNDWFKQNLASLHKLPQLDLGCFNLMHLPKEIIELPLEKLYLCKNQFQTLYLEIGSLSKLKVLDLSYNQLTDLPDEIKNLVDLTELNLNFNKINALPSEINNLHNLKILLLQFNPLKAVDYSIFKTLTNLERLDLKEKALTSRQQIISFINDVIKKL